MNVLAFLICPKTSKFWSRIVASKLITGCTSAQDTLVYHLYAIINSRACTRIKAEFSLHNPAHKANVETRIVSV